jgi:pimeloyl-ACP methyl ester carboxylesterase
VIGSRFDTVIAGVRVAGWTIEPERRVTGDVVLVHGMIVASRSMVPLSRTLGDRGFRCHVLDLPGTGRSERASFVLDVNELGDAAAAWIRSAGLAPASLLGNSFGTQVVAAAAARHPDAVRRLVLLSPTVDPRLRFPALAWLPPPRPHAASGLAPPNLLQRLVSRARAAAIDLQDLVFGTTPPLRALVATEYGVAGPRMIVGTIRRALADTIEARLPEIEAPTLVARGANDALVSHVWAASLADQLPHGTFATVADADHDGEYRSPEAVAAVVAPFLRNGKRSRRSSGKGSGSAYRTGERARLSR